MGKSLPWEVWDTVVMLAIRPAQPGDAEAIWAVLEPVIRGGETYALPREMSRADALAYWFSRSHEVFVAEAEGQVIGTYFLRPNQSGGGSHVSNCGYVTAQAASGKGVATAMCSHSLDYARARGFRAMQFNFLVSTNDHFEIVGRLPGAFLLPVFGYVDAYVMYREFVAGLGLVCPTSDSGAGLESPAQTESLPHIGLVTLKCPKSRAGLKPRAD